MKTTIEIPDALHQQARMRAVEEGTTLRELIITALQRSLQNQSPSVPVPTGAHFVLDEDGWPVLKHPSGTKVTDALIGRLREEEGV